MPGYAIAMDPRRKPSCICEGPFVMPGCPVHVRRSVTLADGSEVKLKAGRSKNPRRVTNFSRKR